MTIALRQICLVAEQLAPTLEALTEILGIHVCHVDPGVERFGLENALLAVGRNFLEVVAPIRDGTAAGRYLERRGGDGGYMVICQADSLKSQAAVLAQAESEGVRLAWSADRDGWNIRQLHPADMIASFLEIDWDEQEDLDGNWNPAGGDSWESAVDQRRTVDFLGVELQGEDPITLAERWSAVTGAPLEAHNGHPRLSLSNATLRFVEALDGRGAGLGGLDLAVRDRESILAAAEARGALVNEHRVDICGTRLHLHDAL